MGSQWIRVIRGGVWGLRNPVCSPNKLQCQSLKLVNDLMLQNLSFNALPLFKNCKLIPLEGRTNIAVQGQNLKNCKL